MSEQPGHMIDEAMKLFEVLRRRTGDGGGGKSADDVWSRAVAEDRHIATGAAECRHCPVCRAIAAARSTGPDVAGHLMVAGQQLYAAFRDVAAAYERTRPAGAPPSPGAETPSRGQAGSSRASRDADAAGDGDTPIDIG